MENIFTEKKKCHEERQKNIEKYQKEIEKLLELRPQLIPLQKEITRQLDQQGEEHSVEGQRRRANLAFELMLGAFTQLRSELELYQQGLRDVLEGKRVNRPVLQLVKVEESIK